MDNNIINTGCITMSEAVTMPTLMMVTSTVSEQSLARDPHTDRQVDAQTDRQTNVGFVCRS